MRIQVRYFASLREALGAAEHVEVEPGTTVGGLRDHLCAIDDTHRSALARPRPIRCALDRSMSEESAVIAEGAEVAFFPPVTGG